MESSSESSGDEEEPEHSDDEAAAGRTLGDWNGSDMAKLPANAEFFRNTQSRVIHLAADESGSSLGLWQSDFNSVQVVAGETYCVAP